ncbi:MAG TPA: hypothetical protein PLS49_07805 [Candidatus Woesebacteria bacterium]|nr:hypothetical protein [Candidatus Woesebacteria bacterium]
MTTENHEPSNGALDSGQQLEEGSSQQRLGLSPEAWAAIVPQLFPNYRLGDGSNIVKEKPAAGIVGNGPNFRNLADNVALAILLDQDDPPLLFPLISPKLISGAPSRVEDGIYRWEKNRVVEEGEPFSNTSGDELNTIVLGKLFQEIADNPNLKTLEVEKAPYTIDPEVLIAKLGINFNDLVAMLSRLDFTIDHEGGNDQPGTNFNEIT